jgi:hypothetical protein
MGVVVVAEATFAADCESAANPRQAAPDTSSAAAKTAIPARAARWFRLRGAFMNMVLSEGLSSISLDGSPPYRAVSRTLQT